MARAMARCHDFENGDAVYFKPEYLEPGEDPRQAYIVVSSHPESQVVDVRPVGCDLPFLPIGMYSHHCFMKNATELELEAERAEAVGENVAEAGL